MKHGMIALDWAESVRKYDNNGFLHVAVSNLTKEQVAPYYGHEIPDWERLGLDPKKTYYGYRSAKELSKPETVDSINGIPIQLGHHLDYPESPAKETRVGHTGTDGKWQAPYLTNSLHFIDKVAQDAINDGSMRELSLAYAYRPDFTEGETDKGEHYDFVMRDILAQHLALVEAGRAGHDVVVNDSEFKEKQMPNDFMDEKEDVEKQPNPDIEKKEVMLGEEIGDKADELVELHDDDGGHVEEDGQPDLDAFLREKGLSDEDIATAHELLGGTGADADIDEEAEVDETPAPAPEDEDDTEADVEGEADTEELPEDKTDEEADKEEELDIVGDALKACGFDGESDEFKKAFGEGVKYGEGFKKKAPMQDLDDEDEGKGDDEENALIAQDSAIKKMEKRFIERLDAMRDCRSIIGDVKFTAFDSAGDVYKGALKQLGVTAGITTANARACFATYMAGKRANKAKRAIATDSKPNNSEMAKLLADVTE